MRKWSMEKIIFSLREILRIEVESVPLSTVWKRMVMRSFQNEDGSRRFQKKIVQRFS